MPMSQSEAGKLGAAKSKIISHQKKQARIIEYNKNPKICPSCDKPLSYDDRNKKFHNRSCAASYNNQQRKLKPKPKCQHCNKPLPTRRGKFCNAICQNTYYWNLRKTEVENNKGSHNAVKKYLLETTGHRCNKCGNTEWNGEPIPLELEHKDGNSENNNLDNTELLCPNCHAQTPTYKNRNKGNGRYARRARYEKGQSY